MSDEYKLINNRLLSFDEKNLLSFLLKKANICKTKEWLDSVKIFPFENDGMGSYFFFETSYTSIASDVLFKDIDGIVVLATLFVSTKNEPCEVDIWKMNYTPLLKIPDIIEDLRADT